MILLLPRRIKKSLRDTHLLFTSICGISRVTSICFYKKTWIFIHTNKYCILLDDSGTLNDSIGSNQFLWDMTPDNQAFNICQLENNDKPLLPTLLDL